MENPTAYLSPEEVSRLTGIKPGTLANWRWAGRGPKFHRLGRSIRYEREELLHWIEYGKVETETC